MLRVPLVVVAASLVALAIAVGTAAPRHTGTSGAAEPGDVEESAWVDNAHHLGDPGSSEDFHEPDDRHERLEPELLKPLVPREPLEPWEPLTPGDDYLPTDADLAVLSQGLRFLEEFVAAIERNDGSCDRMADDIDQLLTANEAFLAERLLERELPGRAAWLAREAESRLGDSMARMVDAVQGCMHSDRLMQVLMRSST